jgi:hypothetical protein
MARVVFSVVGLLMLSLVILALEAFALVYQPSWKWLMALGFSIAVYAVSWSTWPIRRTLVCVAAAVVAITSSFFYFEGAMLSPVVSWPALLFGLGYLFSIFGSLLAVSYVTSSFRVLVDKRHKSEGVVR